jgi:O-antigen/teichoic acid export membrane protein
MEKVPTPPCDAATSGIPPVSLRASFSWTFAGNALYAAGQWAVLSLIAKLGGNEMLGQYALALAITSPVVMLSHLNLRAVLATDVSERHPFGDYFAVRLATTALGVVVIAAIALVSGYSWALAATILVTGLSQSVETVSDIYYGALQRRDRMEQIARSMIARGILSVAALGAALWITRDLIWAVLALALGRLVVLLAYDRPRGAAGESLSRSGWQAELAIMRTALPLGVVLMLISLNTNLPRYVIERRLGTAELGAFAAVASLMTVGSTVVNALGQAATPRLARYFSDHDLPHFRRLAFRLAALGLALGAAGVLGSALLGKVVLRVVYRPEYAAYSGLLVAVMGAAVIGYIAIILGYVSTSARVFAPQMPLFCCVAASSGIASWILVPRFGLYGAALALAVAACLQIGGQAFIFFRAVHRMERAA